MMDMILKFFLQRIDEKGISQNLPLEQVATNYLKGEFLLDLCAFLPFGLFSLYDERFKILWILKVIRIHLLKYYLSQKFFNQFLVLYIEYRQGNSL